MLSPQDLLRPDLADYKAASNLEFNNRIVELKLKGEDVYHCGFGQSPFPIPRCFVDALRLHAHRHDYLPASGIAPLREKIIKFHREEDNFEHFHPDRMVLGAGSKELIFLTMNVFGGDVLLVSPGWTTYRPQCRLSGKTAKIVPTFVEDKFLPRPDVLDKILTEECSKDKHKLIVLNNPNNPSGQCMGEQLLKDLTAVFRKHKVIVLSDEIYARLKWDGPHHSIATFYPEGTIVTTGFSKWASAGGWRAGYGLFPEELLPLYRAVASGGSHTYTCAPAPVQFALNDGLEHADELRHYIRNCSRVLQAVGTSVYRKLTAAGVTAVMPEAAYYFMPDFGAFRAGFEARGVATGDDMCDAMLAEAKVAVRRTARGGARQAPTQLMACDPHYLRPAGELSTRFCFINFDGAAALAESERRGDGGPLDDAFADEYCTRTMRATDVRPLDPYALNYALILVTHRLAAGAQKQKQPPLN